jgi:putative glutamine amidotransferase
MDPASYGADRHPKLGAIDPARDRVELQLVRWALEDRKPVLGLCRGAQIINVALGGTLYQDLAAELPGSLKHDYFPNAGFSRDYKAHEVALAPGSRLHQVMERSPILVNSMHHQGIRDLARELLPTAVAPDGLIEAVERPGDQFLIGVQWHPEMFEMSDSHTRQLFHEFIRASAEWRARAG